MKNLTSTESAVIKKLRKSMVATKSELCDQLEISHMTVVRALNKVGYYTSYNKNSSFYTLNDIPDFDANGLWEYKDIYFSQYVTLENTIVSIVNRSKEGMTAKELESLLKTNVKNILPRLIKKSRLNKCQVRRHAVYLSVDAELKSKQEKLRKRRIENLRKDSFIQKQETKHFPDNLDALTVIKILVQMIEFPSASVASISQSLKHQGFTASAENVRSVIKFYSLEKKTVH